MNYFLEVVCSISHSNKYTKVYKSIVERGLNRKLNENFHKHHILPRSFKLGGEKDKNNLVALTLREHIFVHRVLPKMLINGRFRRKMEKAFSMIVLSHKNSHQLVTSRYVAAAIEANRSSSIAIIPSPETRTKLSTALKGKNKGEKNGMYGRRGALHPNFGLPSPCRGRRHSQETLAKKVGQKRTQEQKERIRLGRKESIAKNGHKINRKWEAKKGNEVFTTNNLKRFCKEHSLDYRKVITCRFHGYDCNGWVFFKLDGVKKVQDIQKIFRKRVDRRTLNNKNYIVTSPDGNEQTISNLKLFCDCNGLTSQTMYAIASGREKTHKGWRCKRFKKDSD